MRTRELESCVVAGVVVYGKRRSKKQASKRASQPASQPKMIVFTASLFC